MSMISADTGEATVTADELQAAAKKVGFSIPTGSQDEADYLKLQNAFDSIVRKVESWPEYIDPRLAPIPVVGGERKWATPDPEDDPLNAWAYKGTIKASKPTNDRLKGKTVAIKANISVAGFPLNVGTSATLFEGNEFPISTIDASVVRRVLEAGAEIRGIATCENFSLHAISTTADTGPVHNAWAPGYVTGGSSSGCAALVSAKDVHEWKNAGRKLPFAIEAALDEGVDMAIGGDQGGSIRIPAHFSGIYGLKPTYGLCPYTGIASLHAMIDHTGPMCRSIDDIATLLSVLAGADGIDFRQSPTTPLVSNVPDYPSLLASWIGSRQRDSTWTATTAGTGLRIGILTESLSTPGLSAGTKALLDSALSRYRDLGATTVPVSVPEHALGPSIWTVAIRAAIPNTLANHAPAMLSHTLPNFNPSKPDQAFFDYMAHRNPAVINVLLNAAHLEQKYGPSITRKTHMFATQLAAAYDAAFEEHELDVLITPVSGDVAIEIPEEIKREEVKLGVMEMALTQVGVTLNTSPFNLSGHPALSMPIGWAPTRDGKGKLPVGMQIVGRKGAELDVLKVAKVWEVPGKGLDLFDQT